MGKSLEQRRKENSLILFCKGLKGKARIPLDDMEIRHNRGRYQRDLTYIIPYAKTDIYKNSFVPKSVRQWNIHPQNLIQKAENGIDPIHTFAKEVRRDDIRV